MIIDQCAVQLVLFPFKDSANLSLINAIVLGKFDIWVEPQKQLDMDVLRLLIVLTNLSSDTRKLIISHPDESHPDESIPEHAQIVKNQIKNITSAIKKIQELEDTIRADRRANKKYAVENMKKQLKEERKKTWLLQ